MKKREEYREINGYWARRLLKWKREQEYSVFCEMIGDMRKPFKNHKSVKELMFYFDVEFKPISEIRFKNGYSLNSPNMTIACSSLTISQGLEEWGAEDGKYYFVFRMDD